MIQAQDDTMLKNLFNGVRMWGHPNAQAFVASYITLDKSYESTTTCRAKELKAS